MADLPRDTFALWGFAFMLLVGFSVCLAEVIIDRQARAGLERDTWQGRRGALLELARQIEAGAALSADDFAPLDGAGYGIRKQAVAAYRGSVEALDLTGERLGVPLAIDGRKALAAMLRAKAGLQPSGR